MKVTVLLIFSPVFFLIHPHPDYVHLSYWRQAETWDWDHAEEKALGTPHCSLSVPRRGLQGSWKGTSNRSMQ